MAEKNLDARIEETIDDLAEKVKLAAERAHRVVDSAGMEARTLAARASVKLREAAEKMRQTADKLDNKLK